MRFQTRHLSAVGLHLRTAHLVRVSVKDKKKAEARRFRLKNASGEPPKTQRHFSVLFNLSLHPSSVL